MKAETLEAKRYAPKSGQVQRIATSTTGAATALASYILGPGWITIKCVSNRAEFYMSTTNGDTVTYGSATAAVAGYPIEVGETQDWLLDGSETYITWDAAGVGELVLCRSSDKASVD